MFFNTLDDAVSHLRPADILYPKSYITVNNSKDSYEYFTQNGRVFYSIGQGYQRSPGHPSANQDLSKQLLIYTIDQQRIFPVFRIFSNCVEYMGNYKYISYKKRVSFAGFQYFEYRFFRQFSPPFILGQV